MKIEVGFPPNFEELQQAFSIDESSEICVTWGDTIYNPYNIPLREDVILHETVHSRQQRGNPEVYFRKYIDSPEFRIHVESEAYAIQLAYIREQQGEKRALGYLVAFAQYLSGPVYGNAITQPKAFELIRSLSRA